MQVKTSNTQNYNLYQIDSSNFHISVFLMPKMGNFFFSRNGYKFKNQQFPPKNGQRVAKPGTQERQKKCGSQRKFDFVLSGPPEDRGVASQNKLWGLNW